MDFKTVLGVFFVLVVAVRGQFNSTKSSKAYYHYNDSVMRADNYIDLHRRQFGDYVLEFEVLVDAFKQHYNERLHIMDMQLELLVDNIVKTNERLNPLEILSDLNKECIAKYRPTIPTIAVTKTGIQACIVAAKNQVNALVSSAETTKNNLKNYYTNNFEKEIVNCEKRFPTLNANYTQCLSTLVTTVTTYTISLQKQYDAQMDAAKCAAKANIKKALDCSFLVQNRTISMNAKANTLIDRCLSGLDDCDRCSQGHYCESVYYMAQHQIDYSNLTMINPFHGLNSTTDCLTLVVY